MKFKTRNGFTVEKIVELISTKNTGSVSYSAKEGLCMYETPEGNHCGVGCLLPSGHKGMGHVGGVTTLLNEYPDLEDILPLGSIALVKLQNIHDATTFGIDPRPAMIKFVEENVEDT